MRKLLVITRLKDAISQDQAATSRTSMLMRILMTTIRNRNFHVVGTCLPAQNCF